MQTNKPKSNPNQANKQAKSKHKHTQRKHKKQAKQASQKQSKKQSKSKQTNKPKASQRPSNKQAKSKQRHTQRQWTNMQKQASKKQEKQASQKQAKNKQTNQPKSSQQPSNKQAKSSQRARNKQKKRNQKASTASQPKASPNQVKSKPKASHNQAQNKHKSSKNQTKVLNKHRNAGKANQAKIAPKAYQKFSGCILLGNIFQLLHPKWTYILQRRFIRPFANEPTSSKVGAVDLGLLAFGLVFLFAFAWFWLQAPHITSLISERTALRLLFVCCFALDLVSGLLLDLPLLFIIDNTCKMCLWMCEYASVCMSECFVNLYMCDSETGWQADPKCIYSAGEGPLAKAKWTYLRGKQAKGKQKIANQASQKQAKTKHKKYREGKTKQLGKNASLGKGPWLPKDKSKQEEGEDVAINGKPMRHSICRSPCCPGPSKSRRKEEGQEGGPGRTSLQFIFSQPSQFKLKIDGKQWETNEAFNLSIFFQP